jgi:hypothetical protein
VEGTGGNNVSFFGNANGMGAMAFGATAEGSPSFAGLNGDAKDTYDLCFGNGAVAGSGSSIGNNVSFGGTATGGGAYAIGQGAEALGLYATALGVNAYAPNDYDIAIGNNMGGSFANLGFFGAPCVAQQAGGGSGTAGAVYTANEQEMLQAVYTALLSYGLIA